ncbi:uncharacterized protein LOC132194222 isoform X2 [Neocloeon triangulifer]|uniref:uncharacterized protein LOC132194222 isoform X2 n=1 Tax=Neocloeon triangulifer TaxID=2078957 RepID=UPI00286F3A8D|nr:uncharacterized protein LOC132194222 isoform X2 [Neocloeon triangulifer]
MNKAPCVPSPYQWTGVPDRESRLWVGAAQTHSCGLARGSRGRTARPQTDRHTNDTKKDQRPNVSTMEAGDNNLCEILDLTKRQVKFVHRDRIYQKENPLERVKTLKTGCQVQVWTGDYYAEPSGTFKKDMYDAMIVKVPANNLIEPEPPVPTEVMAHGHGESAAAGPSMMFEQRDSEAGHSETNHLTRDSSSDDSSIDLEAACSSKDPEFLRLQFQETLKFTVPHLVKKLTPERPGPLARRPQEPATDPWEQPTTSRQATTANHGGEAWLVGQEPQNEDVEQRDRASASKKPGDDLDEFAGPSSLADGQGSSSSTDSDEDETPLQLHARETRSLSSLTASGPATATGPKPLNEKQTLLPNGRLQLSDRKEALLAAGIQNTSCMLRGLSRARFGRKILREATLSGRRKEKEICKKLSKIDVDAIIAEANDWARNNGKLVLTDQQARDVIKRLCYNEHHDSEQTKASKQGKASASKGKCPVEKLLSFTNSWEDGFSDYEGDPELVRVDD